MNDNSDTRPWFRSILCALGLAVSTTAALAVPDLTLGTFDADVGGWGTAWGNATATHDPAQDNTGNGGGACYIYGDFSLDQNTLTVYGCVEGNPWWHPTSANFNMSDYKSLEVDILWDPAASTLSIGEFNSPPLGGEAGITIWAVDYSDFNDRPTLGSIAVPDGAATGWVHVSIPIDPAISGIDPSKGVVFKKWVPAEQVAAGGIYGFWLDNVVLKGTDAPPPPPTVSIDTPTPGLTFIAASGGQWDRQNIRTVGNGYSWVGASGPVSYSLEVAEFADKDHAGFQLHMYFVPGTPDATRSDPDWHEADVLMWAIGNNADGSAYSDVRYKTNAPDSNGIFFSDGNLAGADGATTVGTWTITFNQDTSITTRSPSGDEAAATLPTDVVPLFDKTMQVYVGVVPGDVARIGQMVVLNSVKITGAPGAPDVNSDFLAQPLDTNVWERIAASANGVLEVPTDAAYWVDWTLPALGFGLDASADVVSDAWKSPNTAASFDVGGKHRALVRQGDLPGESAGFFRLIKRAFTKLQILLPGETAAPGTPTGKTGTPLPQVAGTAFDVIVNAVDDDWNLATITTDMISITTTEPTATLPANKTLAGGSTTFSVTFNDVGSFTGTATDVTDNTKAPVTSAPVTVDW